MRRVVRVLGIWAAVALLQLALHGALLARGTELAVSALALAVGALANASCHAVVDLSDLGTFGEPHGVHVLEGYPVVRRFVLRSDEPRVLLWRVEPSP